MQYIINLYFWQNNNKISLVSFYNALLKMKIISGMHRSGTSLVARLFYESGADMGNPNPN